MLIALLLSYVLGGDGTPFSGVLTTATIKDLGDRVATTVTDPTRAEAAAAVLHNARDGTKKFENAYAKSGKKLTEYYIDHAQNEDLMMAALNKLESRWEAAHINALKLRFELKSLMTREEWEEIFEQPQPQ